MTSIDELIETIKPIIITAGIAVSAIAAIISFPSALNKIKSGTLNVKQKEFDLALFSLTGFVSAYSRNEFRPKTRLSRAIRNLIKSSLERLDFLGKC
ncbi:hypothetical protein [Acidithiobacillus ferriphilus]|uniref:hypothetical protein n=1 Tax=Acidithiobacillus ferriphilus TaxID=1689834 RepID=UPI00232C58DE|nr:hypothetical protein [Acidithiobacillus ferriphilus]WCE92929.1 hypothetical protein PJU76_08120 [Acidithiobacillus ferriphilus]